MPNDCLRARKDIMCSEVFNFLLIFRRDGVGNKPERREAGGPEGWWEHSCGEGWGEGNGVRLVCREQE